MEDNFTKWTDAFPIRNQKAHIVADKIVERFVSIFGVPLQIHSDQGRILYILSLRKCVIHIPQSDGMIERANHTIGSMLSAFVDK